MSPLIPILSSLLLYTSCATRLDGPTVVEPWPAQGWSDCLPYAATVCEAMRAGKLEANVLVYQPAASYAGHAITVFFYPPGANQMWGYDRLHGSRRIIAFRHLPEQTARAWTKQQIIRAEYLHAEWSTQ